MKNFYSKSFLCFLLSSFCREATFSYAQADTIRVMAYNVLTYGEYPLCQGPNSIYHAYLDTIVAFANPDILSLEKMGSIQTSPTDHNYTAAIDFQDSILQFALEPAYPGRYSYCPFTNYAASGTESLVFYDQHKLGFIATTCTYTNTEDFNTYKLYYKDPNLAATHDTTFLYVTVNHDQSGDPTADGVQIGGEMAKIKAHFSHLANMINMGDFNLRSSSEPCYQILTAPADTNFRYYDPPFIPDGILTYPANWDGNPAAYAPYLTTSTRTANPNACSSSTGGGGKDWFDHIFISPWIVNNANYISYIPRSFHVIGNDGHRVSIAANSGTNASAPPSVVNSVYQMSNKYPVILELLAHSNTGGGSPPDPEITPSAVVDQNRPVTAINITNPIENELTLHLDNNLVGRMITINCTDVMGRSLFNLSVLVDNTVMRLPSNFEPGVYFIRICEGANTICRTVLTKH